MDKQITETNLAYKNDDGTVYIITPITPVAGVLSCSGIPEDPKKDLAEIWEDSGVSKLVLFVPAEQQEYINAARSVGFKQEGRLKKATLEGDLLIFGQYR